MPLEIASFTTSSALLANSNGAHRIELCTDQHLGGTTPLLSTFKTLKSQLPTTIPINVMIRPRGGDFFYTDTEFSQMKGDLEKFREAGADGFVFGILTPGGEVDEERCKELLRLSNGRPCTFHRAFDELSPSSMEEGLESLIKLGFTSVLTSGGKPSAIEGKEVLKGLVQRARGRIDVIVGGGVRARNAGMLRRETGAEWFHSSAIAGEGDEASGEEVEGLRRVLEEGG